MDPGGSTGSQIRHIDRAYIEFLVVDIDVVCYNKVLGIVDSIGQQL